MAGSRRSLLALGLCAALGMALLPAPLESRTRSYVLADASSGTVLKSVNADVKLHPASLTKMMTLYLVFEAVRNGKVSMDQRVKVSRYASRIPPSRLGLRQGRRVLVRHLVAAAAIRSANDAAVVLAEAVAGSEEAFARRMTRKARALGMHSTTFKNATGFTARGHLSTARDMAILGRRLMRDFPEHSATYKRRHIRWGGRRIAATNSRFLNAYSGADGIKTGYTRAAGYTIVGSARRGGHHLVVSYFGASSSYRRATRVSQILNEGFAMMKRGDVVLATAIPDPAPRPGANAGSSAASHPGSPAVAGATAASSASAGGWQIQIGAFRSRGRALKHGRRVAGRHASATAGGRVEVVRSGRLHAARLAGYDRKTADRVCRSLKKSGTDCFVLARPEARQAIRTASLTGADAASSGRSSGTWSVQVGAYSRASRARGRIEELRRAGINELADRDFAVPRSGRYYLSRFTGFDAAGARSACASLERREIECLAVGAREEGPSPGAAASAGSGAAGEWSVQVGTFRLQSSARRELVRVRNARIDVLAGKPASLVREGGRTKVRFGDFGSGEAKSACKDLARRGFECLPIRQVSRPPRAASGGWAIQVGAYDRASMARKQIRRVEGRGLDMLADAEAWVPKKGRYYLARFRNLDRQRANDACSALAERGVDCLAVSLSR